MPPGDHDGDGTAASQPRLTLLRRVLRTGRPAGFIWVALLALSYPLLYLAATLPWPAAFAAAMVTAHLAERYSLRYARRFLNLLGRIHLNVALRYTALDAALLLLVVRTDHFPQATIVALTLGLVGLHGLRGLIVLLREYVTRRRTLPILTRNVDLSDLRIPDAPPRFLVRGGIRRWLSLSIPAAAGVLVDLAAGTAIFATAGLGAGILAGVIAAGVLLGHALRVRHLGDRARSVATVQEMIRRYRPEVALYYSSGQDTAYQVNMWLSTLANLSRRPLIIMRERVHLPKIARTSIPIVCITGASDVMDFDLPDLKVALYVGNVGKNIHMLRASSVKHVFIGHGDSDKQASANPASKVYDEVWVAGPAGRERYHRARAGVRDEAIVEVGRPQLVEVKPAGATAGQMFTVLYAPTWEGWSGDMYLTSVHTMGAKIIETLLAYSPAIRVIYKPHPLTGLRHPAVRASHRAIVDRLASANEERLAVPEFAEVAAQAAAGQSAARDRMRELDQRAGELQGSTRGRDQAQWARDSGVPDVDGNAELDRCATQWQQAYWQEAGWWSHRTVTGARPSLYSCFNQADLLISDISSVVSDFIASEKPYVVTNLADVDETTFRAEQTAARGAYLLPSDCSTLTEVLDLARLGGGSDRMAERRRDAKHYLLGPDEPDAMTRFNDAVEALAQRRDREVREAMATSAPHRPPVTAEQPAPAGA